jgi:outer membrane protein assembly factor BamD (BamD/ComL family)
MPPSAAQGQYPNQVPYPGPVQPGPYPGPGAPGPYPAQSPPNAYPGQGAPPSGYPNQSPPPNYPNGVVPTSYQTPYPDTGMPPAPIPASPAASGMVPVGASGVAPAGQDVVPPGVTLPPAGPTPPPGSGAISGSSRDPMVSAPPPDDAAKAAEDKSGFDVSKLAPDALWKSLKQATGYGPDQKLAKATFQEGEALFRQKKYKEAVDKFYTASWRWPDSPMEEDSLFLMGECYFFSDQYGKADDTYANLLKKFDNTRYLDTVMSREFAIGRYWDKMDEKHHQWPTTPNLTDRTMPWFDAFDNAINAYDRVRLHDPTGPLADDAVMATANAYFRIGHYEEAAYHYDILRRDYPKSEFQKDAHILGLQAKWHVYQGAEYDAKPLDGAKEIAQQTLTQFPGKLGEEERRVAETRARIIEQQAEREWAMGQFYEKKSGYGAARYYYKSLIQAYPSTRYAELAKAQLEKIRDKPDNPPKPFAWLGKIVDRKE